MLDLNVIREQIDGIDKQLVDLFEQRMKLTKEVAEYKIQTGKKVLDTQRERAKIEAVTKLVKNEANVHAIDDLFSQIMANSRKGQYQLLEAMVPFRSCVLNCFPVPATKTIGNSRPLLL